MVSAACCPASLDKSNGPLQGMLVVFVVAVSTFAAAGVLVRGRMDDRAAADVCLPGCLQPYSPELLREFVAYARARVQPALTPAAESRLIESYKDLRRQCSNEKVCRVAGVPASART